MRVPARNDTDCVMVTTGRRSKRRADGPHLLGASDLVAGLADHFGGARVVAGVELVQLGDPQV